MKKLEKLHKDDFPNQYNLVKIGARCGEASIVTGFGSILAEVALSGDKIDQK